MHARRVQGHCRLLVYPQGEAVLGELESCLCQRAVGGGNMQAPPEPRERETVVALLLQAADDAVKTRIDTGVGRA